MASIVSSPAAIPVRVYCSIIFSCILMVLLLDNTYPAPELGTGYVCYEALRI